MREKFGLMVVVAITLCACSKKEQIEEAYDPAHDYFSYANTEQFVTTHLALDLVVDFDARELRGGATLTLQKLDSAATEIVLDTRDLGITGIQVLLADGVSVAADYRFGESDKIKGTPLIVSLPARCGDGVQSAGAIHDQPGFNRTAVVAAEADSGW